LDTTPRKILLIEDNPGDVRLIREFLSESKYGIFTVISAPRLSDGLELLAKETIDLVLLDLGLPDSQGIDTFTRVNEKALHLPIVILTGQNDEVLGIRAVGEGAQDYLVKGEVNSNLLTRTLSYAIERKRVEKLLLNYQSRLRSLASEVSLAEERERRRIATDVHDDISQTLAFCTMKLSLLMKSNSAAATDGRLQEIYDCLQQIATATRSLTFELSPPELYDFGLEAAVAGLCERMAKEHDIPIYFEDDGGRKNIENDLRVELFRMVRELLVNAIKHAEASSLRVAIARSGQTIRITVEDDGIGFDTKILAGGHGGGFGLFSIQDRLQYMGGRLDVESRKGEGSRFTVVAPLKSSRTVSKKRKN
jgi:signal transduction histidine kinase